MAVSPILVIFGAIYPWYPKITGRMMNDALGQWHFWITFLGTYLIYYPMHYLGFQGMPRRYYAYLPEYQTMHQVSTIGSYILAIGLFWTLAYLVVSLFKGAKAPANPWQGVSLEWHTQSPPIEHNFHETPHVTGSPYDFPEIDKSAGFHPPH